MLMPYNKGFTLAEMAIVVVIASILLMAGVKVLTAQMDSASFSASRSKQEAIRQALITYLGNFQRLPCPDTRTGDGTGGLSFSTATPPDGIENRSTAGDVTSNCAASFGVLPYQTLGLARDVAVDGWGNLFSYHVSTAGTNWALSNNFSDTHSGGLILNDRDTSGAVTQLTGVAVVSLISHGKNGNGAFTIKGTRAPLPNNGTNSDERENTDADTTYFKREYTDVAGAGGVFDDLVMQIMAEDLIAPLRRDGTIKNMQTAALERLQDNSESIVGYMMGSGCNTPLNLTALGLSSTVDPWGTEIMYISNYATPPIGRQLTASDVNLVPGGSAASIAFTLTSYGPDRAVGGSDNIVLSKTVGQLRGLLGTAYASRCP